MRGEFDHEQIAHLAIEVGDAGLGLAEDADRPSVISAAVIAAPLSLSAARGKPRFWTPA
jgi:hypothetical protein